MKYSPPLYERCFCLCKDGLMRIGFKDKTRWWFELHNFHPLDFVIECYEFPRREE